MVVSFSVSFPFVPKLFVLSAFMPPIATLPETNTTPGPSHAVYGSSPNLPALGPTNTYYFSSPVPTLLGQLCMQGSDSFPTTISRRWKEETTLLAENLLGIASRPFG